MFNLKILILTDSLAVGGGAERIATILGDELYHKGHYIYYLTFMDKNPKYSFKGEYFSLDQSQTDQNILRKGLNFLSNSLRIKNICKDYEVETIISVGEVANLHAVLSSLFFSNQVRVIISQHINPQIHLNSKLKVKLINFFYSKAYKTICVSKDIERILNEDFKVDNTMTIYNMVDLEKNIKLSHEELPDDAKKLMGNGKFIFINLGSLFPQKGHWFLIRSFRKVVDVCADARLFILGEGDLREKLEDLIEKLNLGGNVFLLGNKENVFAFLANSHCFVFSSLWEGLPMTLIEALSLNLPIISTDCKTGPREALCPELDLIEKIEYPYFGKYGILTEPFPYELLFKSLQDTPLKEYEDMLAELIINMMENPDLRDKYAHGRDMAGNFDKNKIIDEWEKLLQF